MMIRSLEGAISAKKAIGDQMQSQQYWRISELCRAEGRVQSFFQAAPQAWLQLIIWMENLNDTSSNKGNTKKSQILNVNI